VDLVGGDHEHTLDLGQLRDGVHIRYRTEPLMPVFEKMISQRCYEACEFSLSNYIMLKDRGADWLTGIPVFPQRAFRHANFYVRKDSDLDLGEPQRMGGKRIAVPDYSMTLAVWMRGVLNDQYGLHWSKLSWIVGARPRFATLEGLRYETSDKDIEQALVDGDIDILLAPRTRDEKLAPEQRRLRPLIDDPQQAEEAYLAQTGIYPINHVVVIRSDTLERIPEIGRVLYAAYDACKQKAYERRLGTTLVPWGARHWAQALAKFRGDPMEYGLTPGNRNVVERLCAYLLDQKLIGGIPQFEALFPLRMT